MMARVTFLGLNMDAATQAEIIAACKALWPNETAGMSDFRAAQTVLKLIIKDIVARYRGMVAVPDAEQAIRDAQDNINSQRENAINAGRDAVEVDVLVTAP